MAKVLKKTTGLTGIAVSKDPKFELDKLYRRILKVLSTLPQESAYKRNTEKLIREKHEVIQQTNDVAVIEEKIGCGQAEEVIIQAKNELALVEQMSKFRPWERLIEEPPENQWTWPPHK
ncbi:NADH dehydrogenase [ubiquinone] 1 alpha subcomplex subunit 5 [Colletes gigas]|uniref:NADH dehydrogenase [ubiquinone] 1 alpha subcomplex subunit 5 n=1 Tax=Colletes gigas TaxID=935657 RepID=UPI001C9B13FB|nr:NADH dehydrogenase [ubiquinone] 1 alpha subcomplex subunit 5 [Colletes gigas]